MVYFFVDEEEKCREKQLFSAVNGKVSQSLGNFFFFFFITNEQKFETFFFFLVKLNILRVVLLTQYFYNKTYVASC